MDVAKSIVDMNQHRKTFSGFPVKKNGSALLSRQDFSKIIKSMRPTNLEANMPGLQRPFMASDASEE